MHMHCHHLRILQVGCGGIGGFLATHTARIARECERLFDTTTISFFDGDLVEGNNLRRQNFSISEVGLNKAETLAFRLNAAWGMNIQAYPRHFHKSDVRYENDTLTLILGCVDNYKARVEMHQSLEDFMRYENAQNWWLDGGNLRIHGQVLIGNCKTLTGLAEGFSLSNICQALPSPALVHPELVRNERKSAQKTAHSCAELMHTDPQSLTINSIIASHMADYMLRLLVTKDLKRFATYIDMDTGSTRSLPTTPAVINRVLGQPVIPTET